MENTSGLIHENEHLSLKDFYKNFSSKCSEIRKHLGRPITYGEKVLFSHLCHWSDNVPKRGVDTLVFAPDRVAMQDATAQMAVLQFMTAGLDTVKVPTTIHCDHLIRAENGVEKDLPCALQENKEVYEFLKSAAARYGMGFWQAGAGIIHQVVLEQHAFPGGMMVGTDSHTPNAGGLGMLAIGVGGADAVDVMAGLPWGLLNPKIIGINLTGKLQGWSSAKDVILKIAGLLKVKGGTGCIIEYFGEGTKNISTTGKATITNMGAELGATASIFPYDELASTYLRKTERAVLASFADNCADELRADLEVEQNPEKYFDQVLEIDLSQIEPQWSGPHTPDLVRTKSEILNAIKSEGYPDEVSAALIGSCTDSSYEDLNRASKIAQQALDNGIKLKCPFFVSPGSDQVYATVKRDGILEPFLKLGAIILTNACGPCIGQWKRNDGSSGKLNTIVTSFNRNFRKRNDGNESTLNFIGSPESVTIAALSGRLSFDPNNECLKTADGNDFKFTPPQCGALPEGDFKIDRSGFTAGNLSVAERSKIQVKIDIASERLAKLDPFLAWKKSDFENLRLLVKAKGKCTTDHISQAGVWLKYRGHLPNISKNMLLGATNAFNGEIGKVKNVLTNEEHQSIPDVALYYKQHRQGWIIVGDENYGEGSSREHAAMEPRYLGCCAVIVKSFARIHETNLKKQGLLPLTFVNPADYDLIGEDDTFELSGTEEISVGSTLYLHGHNTKGEEYKIPLCHSLTQEQIGWFKAGSALNSIRKSEP